MLTQKQERFCLKFIELDSASKAMVAAGYSPRYAAQNADHVLKLTKVQNRIAALRKRLEDESIMGPIERRQRLSEIARARLTDFMELGQDGSWVNIGKETPQSGAIAEIHSRTEYDDDGAHPTVHTSVKLHDPAKAIDLLNKMDKLYAEAEAKVNINLNQKLEARIVQFDAREVARAILEAEQLGLTPGLLGGNGHREDASLLPAPTDVQATPVSGTQDP